MERREGEGVEGDQYVGLRAQKPPPPGTRPAALKEPVPQDWWPGAPRQQGHEVPSLAPPSLAGATADGVDSSSLLFLAAAALRKLKEEEMVMMVEEEEVVEEPAPAVSAAPAPVDEYVAPAPAVSPLSSSAVSSMFGRTEQMRKVEEFMKDWGKKKKKKRKKKRRRTACVRCVVVRATPRTL